ncbi:protein translocase subunit SecD [Pantoea sp. Aalb]|uniref:protein translocase subunit SecD n=1 Tax=Pantoea sp. Aalb TaxID=2576762 RepID=UPI00132C20FE|nr:protein translocase subunit SecD [Pantoea sp. Aalb]MXP67590.1 protein translocase subunit SecD [Pantoea sp. Aalb]
MLNRYPLWKYIMLIIVIIVGLLYALPNFYGEYPAIQITGVHGVSVNQQTLDKTKKILKNNNIEGKSIILKNRMIIICFTNTDIQLHARELIANILGINYVVTLNLTPITPNWLKMISAEPMKLGLDLRGGVYFLMAVNMKAVLEKLQNQYIDTLSENLRNENIHYTKFKKITNYGIEIFFKNVDSRNIAITYLTLHNHNLDILKRDTNKLQVMLTHSYINQEYEYAIQQNINILRSRVNQLGIAEPLVQRYGYDRIIVELPGIQDTALAKEIIGATATLEFRLLNTDISSITSVNGNLPIDSEVKQTSDGKSVILYKRIILSGSHIIDSTYSMDEYNQPQVNISLDNIGSNIMFNFTKNNIGKVMATLFKEYKGSGKKDINNREILIQQEKIINIAKIQSRISKNFRITGINNINEARHLSLLLRFGALTAPIQILEERTIGPTMGQQNIIQGFKACLCGLIVCIIFMIFFYKKFGFIATSALLCNLILIVGIMSLLPGATLTMPGLAGILLTLAVAVDANVLINERIKEELRNGRTVQQAINEGYKGAFSSIFDANITTLIKTIILYTVGNGVIKGFAITTAIGIITSMFTAIVGTRAIVNLIYGGKRIDKLSI